VSLNLVLLERSFSLVSVLAVWFSDQTSHSTTGGTLRLLTRLPPGVTLCSLLSVQKLLFSFLTTGQSVLTAALSAFTSSQIFSAFFPPLDQGVELSTDGQPLRISPSR